jgi:hypothetical protein
MVAQAATTVGAGGILFTTLMGSGIINDFTGKSDTHMELKESVFESGVLSQWSSEALGVEGNEPFDDECQFFNFTTAFTSEFCEPFAITRIQTSVTNAAISRSVRCAAKFDLECVLSSEIGFAVPAAFVADPKSEFGMRELIAPKVVDQWTGGSKTEHSDERFVRINVPSDTFNTRTVRMNDTLTVEYMTKNRRMVQETLKFSDSFCVNLLRVAFSNACWSTLDG